MAFAQRMLAHAVPMMPKDPAPLTAAALASAPALAGSRSAWAWARSIPFAPVIPIFHIGRLSIPSFTGVGRMHARERHLSHCSPSRASINLSKRGRQ